MCLSRDKILSAPKYRLDQVHVPEWTPPGENPELSVVWIRTMSGRERREFFAKGARYRDEDGRTLPDSAEKLVADFVCDEKGSAVFTPDDVAELAERDADVVARIAIAILHHCAILKEAVEQAEKNFVKTPSDSSASGSPSPSDAPLENCSNESIPSN